MRRLKAHMPFLHQQDGSKVFRFVAKGWPRYRQLVPNIVTDVYDKATHAETPAVYGVMSSVYTDDGTAIFSTRVRGGNANCEGHHVALGPHKHTLTGPDSQHIVSPKHWLCWNCRVCTPQHA